MISFLTALFLTFVLLVPMQYAGKRKKTIKLTTLNGVRYYEKHDKWYYLWYLFAVAPILFVTAFRDRSVGSDNRGIYYSTFIRTIRGTEDKHFEIGFRLLVKAISSVTDNYQWFDIVTSLFILGVLFYVIERDSNNIAYSYLLFIISGMYIYSLSGIRQYVAIVIMMAGCKHIYEKNLWKYVICVVTASLFHTGILVTLVLYFLVNYKKRIFTPKVMLLALCGLFVFRQIAFILIEKILSGTKYYYYIMSMSGTVFQKFVFIIHIGIFIIMLFCYKTASADKKYMLAYWSQALTIAMVMFTGIIPEISRVAWYFMAYQIIGIPVTMSYIKKKYHRIIFNMGIIGVYIVYFVYDFIYMKYYDVIPYNFCFLSK